MRKSLSLVIKGFIIGIANIIPGVSGGTLAITLGIYEDLIGAISHFFSKLKDNLKLLCPIGVGAILSILVLSNLIKYALENYKIPTTLFFVGLIIGGIPLLIKKLKEEQKSEKSIINYLVFILTFIFVALFAFLKEGNAHISFSSMDFLGYIKLFVVGAIAAATMVIPGISGSFVLMMLGYYEPIINVVSEISHLNNIVNNLLILIPLGIGLVVGIVLIAKLIEYLLKNHPVKTYYGIIGFVCASLISIITPLFSITFNIGNIIVGLILLIIGSLIAYKLGGE